MVLTQVAQAIEAITDRQVQRNLAAASGILAGLVLNKDVIGRILRSEIMRELVIYQQILEEGEARGRAEGKAEGKAEATRELALNLLRMGMSLEQIALATELPSEQIQALQNEIQ